MSAAIDNRSAHINLRVTIEPLLAQHGDKRGEEGSSQTRIKDRLDVDDSTTIEATPSSESGSGSGAGWNVPNRDTGYDHEVVAQLCVIRLKVALNVDDESGCNCGEQTGLYPQKNQMNIATDLGVKEILTKIKVVFRSSSYFFIKSRSHLSASR